MAPIAAPGVTFAHLSGFVAGMVTGVALALAFPTRPSAALSERPWNLDGFLRDTRPPLSRRTATLLTLGVSLLATAWALQQKHSRAAVSDQRVFYWAQRCIRQHVEGGPNYSFSKLGGDERTGCQQVSTNRWQVREWINSLTGRRAQWEAVVESKGVTANVMFLQIGANVLVTNGAPAASSLR